MIRHTTPQVSQGICYGQLDLEVELPLFNEESKVIQSKISEGIEKVYSSPLKRCAALAQTLNHDFQQCDLLKELNFGTWEGKEWSKIPRKELDIWMEDFVNSKVPEGESYIDLFNRTEAFIGELLKTPLKKVAIVTHAGNIRSFISYVLGLSLENSFRITLHYGAVVHLEIHENPALGKLKGIY